MTTHVIGTLPEGTRFKYPECGKIATVVSHGQMGTRIKFEHDARTITIEADEFTGRPARTFTTQGKVEIVSSGSDVLLWPKGTRDDSGATPSNAGGKHKERGLGTLTVAYARIPEDRRRASAGGERSAGVTDTQANPKPPRAGAIRKRKVRRTRRRASSRSR